MSRAAVIHEGKSRRVRASKPAILAALEAIKDAGLPVEKLCIAGGQVEIHCRPVEGNEAPANDGGLKEW